MNQKRLLQILIGVLIATIIGTSAVLIPYLIKQRELSQQAVVPTTPDLTQASGTCPTTLSFTNLRWDEDRYRMGSQGPQAPGEIRFNPPVFMKTITAIDWDTTPDDPTVVQFTSPSGETKTISASMPNNERRVIDINFSTSKLIITPGTHRTGDRPDSTSFQIEYTCDVPSVTPSPTPQPSSSPTPTATPRPSSTLTPTPTRTPTPTPRPSSTPTPRPSSSPTPTPSSCRLTVRPRTVTGTPTPTSSPTPTRTPTPSPTTTPTSTPTPTLTVTPTPPPGSTPTPTPTITPTPPPGSTPTPTPTNTPAPSVNPTATPTPMIFAEKPKLPEVGTSLPTFVLATIGFFIIAAALALIL